MSEGDPTGGGTGTTIVKGPLGPKSRKPATPKQEQPSPERDDDRGGTPEKTAPPETLGSAPKGES